MIASRDWSGELAGVRVGHPLVDEYLEFARSRARPNTVLAQAFDLKVFFETVDKTPVRVTSADVMAFIRSQQRSGSKVIRIDGSSGLSPRTIRRRLSTVSTFHAYVLARADWAGTSEQMISTRYRHRLRRVSRLRPGDPR